MHDYARDRIHTTRLGLEAVDIYQLSIKARTILREHFSKPLSAPEYLASHPQGFGLLSTLLHLFLRRQLFHPSFAARISWEKRARVFFARTVRAHMRDPAFFSAENVWTEDDAVLADALVCLWRTRRDLDAELLPAAFVQENVWYELDDVCRVWARLQTYPHNF